MRDLPVTVSLSKRSVITTPSLTPDAVNVIENVDGDNVELTLVVAEDDTGMVIGRHGKIAKAIRQIMKAAANTCGKHVTVEIK